jgi:hypothetical protein
VKLLNLQLHDVLVGIFNQMLTDVALRIIYLRHSLIMLFLLFLLLSIELLLGWLFEWYLLAIILFLILLSQFDHFSFIILIEFFIAIEIFIFHILGKKCKLERHFISDISF